MSVLLERLDAERLPEESQARALKRLTESNMLVFRSPEGSTISCFSKIMTQLHKASATSYWTYHDCRRTFASHLGEAGQDRDVVDGILNHKASSTSSGVMGVYNRSTRWPAQVAVMNVWGKMLGGFVGVAESEQPEAGNVVAFGKGAA
jgi:integrase